VRVCRCVVLRQPVGLDRGAHGSRSPCIHFGCLGYLPLASNARVALRNPAACRAGPAQPVGQTAGPAQRFRHYRTDDGVVDGDSESEDGPRTGERQCAHRLGQGASVMAVSPRRVLTGIVQRLAGLVLPPPVLTPQPVPVPSAEPPPQRARD
jgi:hypothetical protein